MERKSSHSELVDSIVEIYCRKDGIAHRTGYGVIIRTGDKPHVLTASHVLEEDEEGEIWDAVHPEVAQDFGFHSAARMLWKGGGRGLRRSEENDLVLMPLAESAGIAIDVVTIADLLTPAFIACIDYVPKDDYLVKRLDAMAGLIEQENDRAYRLSCEGREGMSGAPVFVRDSDGGEFRLLSIYTGTPRTTPLTRANIEKHAFATKIGKFLRGA
ncbi:MAG: trypsin-like peptidase domain-containing protein [Acidithiobacillus sp.]